MSHDSEYFRRRAAEARGAASSKADSEMAEVAGDLALAYSALARRELAGELQRDAAAPALEAHS